MKRILVLTLLFLFSGQIQLNASMDPAEIEEMKNDAPLQLIGEVKNDKLIQERDTSYPSQLRNFQLEIEQIIKKPNHFEEAKGDTINIRYFYIPSWVQMVGGKRMDIMVGDQIEIWLEKGENGWESVVSGNTVNHLNYVEPREEHIPEPPKSFSEKVSQVINENLATIVITVFIMFLIGIGLLIRRITIMRKGY